MDFAPNTSLRNPLSPALPLPDGFTPRHVRPKLLVVSYLRSHPLSGTAGGAERVRAEALQTLARAGRTARAWERNEDKLRRLSTSFSRSLARFYNLVFPRRHVNGAELPKIAARHPSTPPFSPGAVIPGIRGKMCSSTGFVFGQLETGPLTRTHSDLLIYGSQGNSRYAARIR